jgi:hypothetical protein
MGRAEGKHEYSDMEWASGVRAGWTTASYHYRLNQNTKFSRENFGFASVGTSRRTKNPDAHGSRRFACPHRARAAPNVTSIEKEREGAADA